MNNQQNDGQNHSVSKHTQGLLNRKKPIKQGFTLAEVLITLSIIGVVAALTIPQLVKNMNDYAFGKSKDITLAKITEATNQMKSNDVLSGYATNDAFLNEFQKYMKVTKTCDSTTLVNCFPAKFKAGTEDIDTTTLTTGTKLGANNITGNTIGLMLANGTSILFTLRDSTKVSGACDRIDPTDNQINTTGCMSFLYDINGYGAPNVLGKDIGNVNVTLNTCTGIKLSGTCFSMAAAPLPLSIVQCQEHQADWGITACPVDSDYYAGAAAQCGGKNNLPNATQMKTLLTELYPTGTWSNPFVTGPLDYEKAASIGLPGSGGFQIWSNGESGFNAMVYGLYGGSSGYNTNGSGRQGSTIKTICVK